MKFLYLKIMRALKFFAKKERNDSFTMNAEKLGQETTLVRKLICPYTQI